RLELSERQFRRSLQEVALRERREGRTDSIECPVRRNILSLLELFETAQVVGHKVVGARLQDRIEIRIRGAELASRNIDLGAAEPSRLIIGIDLEGFTELPHSPSRIAARPQHLAFNLVQFG